jgi:hypothetical protein
MKATQTVFMSTCCAGRMQGWLAGTPHTSNSLNYSRFSCGDVAGPGIYPRQIPCAFASPPPSLQVQKLDHKKLVCLMRNQRTRITSYHMCFLELWQVGSCPQKALQYAARILLTETTALSTVLQSNSAPYRLLSEIRCPFLHILIS